VANILTTVQALMKSALADSDPARPLPTILDDAADRLEDLFVLDLDPSGAGLEQWLAKFRSLTGDVALRETLVIRVLQVKLPRAAEVLALVGAITLAWDDAAGRPRAFGIDWTALEGFGSRPGDQAMKALLSRVRGLPDLKALQVLLLLLISGPDELVSLECRRMGFLALPAGDGVDLTDLTNLVNSPVAVPLATALGLAPATLTWIGNLPPLTPGSARIELDAPDAVDPLAVLDGLAATIVADASAVRAAKIPLWGTGWVLTGDTSGQAQVTARMRIDGNAVDLNATGRSSAQIRLFIGRSRAPGDDALRFGDATGTHFAIRDVRVGVTFSPVLSEPPFGYTLSLDGVRFGVGTDLLAPLAMGLPLPGALVFDSAVDLSFLQGVGLQGGTAGGGLSLGIDIPKHLGFVLGGSGAGLWVDGMLLRVEVSIAGRQLAFRVLFRFDARAELGPIKATMTGAGAWIGRWTSGNAGLLEPTGIGLSLSAGPVSGSGFFGALGPGEYGGALSLKILGIGAFAYGIYKELPGGGVSFVAVIGIRLPAPGIQVGFGFAISGFGGLIGINRRADTDKLRDRLVSGTAGDILFTDDPTKNAPRILGELRTLFPDEPGVHVFGPTIQLNWLSIVKLDMGLFIELPGPRKIFIAGSGRMVIGSEDFALVYFRLDFIGGVDLTASLIFFDGALVNSHLLGIMRITGGLAFRLAYGANGYFVLSIGGFHPQFVPGGLALPKVPRAGASVDLSIVWFRQEMYFAITSNTVQFGSRTEAGVEIGPISVHGWFGFDALIQFTPFHFVATVDAGMAASFSGVEFASIRVRGELSGPGPLVLRATASVKILIRVSKSVTITLDRTPPESVPQIENLATHLRDEIRKPANLRAEGEDRDVVFLAPGAGTALKPEAIVPVGKVVWEQKRVPLDRTLEKAEGRPLPSPRRLTVAVTGASTTPEEDLFALGTFANLSDAEALSGPTFSPGRSGFQLEIAQRTSAAGSPKPYDDGVEVVRLPARSRFTSPLLATFSSDLLESLVERGRGAAVKKQSPAVTVAHEPWKLPNGGPQHAADAFLEARAASTVAIPVSTPAVSLAGVL
jgi:hypothetical protein